MGMAPQSRRVATVYSDVSSVTRAGVCSCVLPGLFHACSTLSSLLLPVRGSVQGCCERKLSSPG